MKKLLSLLLAAALLLGLAGCAAQEVPHTAPGAEAAPVYPELPHLFWRYFDHDLYHGDISYADMQAEEWDYGVFDRLTTDVVLLRQMMAADALFSELEPVYHRLYDGILLAGHMSSRSFLLFEADVNDAEAAERDLELDNLLTRHFDDVCAALGEMARDDRYRGDFIALIGEERVDAFAEYEEMTDEELELNDRESELEQEYTRLLSEIDDPWALNDAVGPIFLELIEVRNRIAQINGYDNYVDYSYEEIYMRDYTPEDARLFHENVKATMGPILYGEVVYLDSFYGDVEADPSAEEQLTLLGEYASRVNPEFRESYEYMISHGLYDVDDREGMDTGAFTTDLPLYSAPFLYSCTYGDAYDLTTLVHEFGHYNDAYYNQAENYITDSGALDIFEIHSTGLQVMFLPYYGEMFGPSDAAALKTTELGLLMYNVVSGCMEDEFQQFAYTTPGVTVEQLNRAYSQIGSSYGCYMGTENPDWAQIPHTFTSPLYYISYAVSAVPALELYTISRTSVPMAQKTYSRLVSYGAYDYGYYELLDMCGLTPFTDGDFIAETADLLLEDMEEADGRY